MDIQELKTYARYNRWANERLIKKLQTLSDEQLDQEIVSSFSSIISTIKHNWLAEFLWLERWKGTSLETFPYLDYQGTNQEMLKDILNTSNAVTEYVEAQGLDTLSEVITISTLSGSEYKHPRYQMIHHCLNHSTYHRGQIVMMLKQLGIADVGGPYDYIWYLRELQH